MLDKPSTARECAICQRVEARIRDVPAVKRKLTSDEIDELIDSVQGAVLKKPSNGVTMSNETVILKKAHIDEMYDALHYTLLLVEKMADRMERHDAILVQYGAELADVMAKADAALGLDVEEDGEEGENFPPGDAPDDLAAAPSADAPAPAAAAPAPAAPAAPSPELEPKMPMAAPSAPAPGPSMGYPAFNVPRPVPAQDMKAAVDTFEKSYSNEELAKMTPQQVNAKLKSLGLLY
jgi:hypothetical protein